MYRVAALHDLSGLGRCSLTAAIPVLSAMGHQVCPVPTAVLSGQTGFADYAMVPLPGFIARTAAHWRRLGIAPDAVYSGFLATPEQGEEALSFIRAFKRSGMLAAVDPVLGDDGRIFPCFDGDMLTRMRALVSVAGLATPNLTECCLLTGTDYGALTAQAKQSGYLQAVAQTAQRLRRSMTASDAVVAVTGIALPDGGIANLLHTNDGWTIEISPRIAGRFSGTGDLFASVLTGGRLRGMTWTDAAALATRFLEASIEEADDPEMGVPFEKYLPMLIMKSSDEEDVV